MLNEFARIFPVQKRTHPISWFCKLCFDFNVDIIYTSFKREFLVELVLDGWEWDSFCSCTYGPRLIACPISPQLLKKSWRSELFWHPQLPGGFGQNLDERISNSQLLRNQMSNEKRTRGWYRKLYYPVLWGLFCKPWNKDPYETADILLFERLGLLGALVWEWCFRDGGDPANLLINSFGSISAKFRHVETAQNKVNRSWHVDTIDFFRSKEVIYQIFIIIFM